MAEKTKEGFQIADDPLWYKDAIIYEFHVRAFFDSNGDGVGDFGGLAEKLDYLQDLGVTTLWLLPFYPSPLRDDGYDIADFTDVNPAFGTLRDFKTFLREAHRRGLRVITELVLNHTSDQHPWFQRARKARPGSAERNFYVWSDNTDRYRDARIIFKDFESSNWAWDPVAKAYYWHRFYSHQPDLNYENPQVQKAMLQVLDFWFGMGVDGLRLDAVPYLYEREGTICENLPETHAFLKMLRQHVEKKFKNRMLLAEANQWPEDGVAYFGESDECHMAFHFPLMPRLFMAIRMEDRFPIIEILDQTPAIPSACQWATFLRNHDELTLEMVTDEERDYMYRVYAHDPHARINLGIRRRLAPLLGNNTRRIELMNGLLFSLIGTPVIYYGDEIGMGDNIYLGDRNGVRTPLQWNADQNSGFSRGNPQKLYLPVIIDPEYHYEAVNVESQQQNPSSPLWWMKRLIYLRKRFQAFGRGTLEMLHPSNRKVLAFLRRFEDENVLVVANLSRFAQFVEIDLSAFQGQTPVELFGRNEFPSVGDQPYFLTLGPHSFYWFSLETKAPLEVAGGQAGAEPPAVVVGEKWEEVFEGPPRHALEDALVKYIQGRRWFGGKARSISSLKLKDILRLNSGPLTSYLTTLHVEFIEGDPQDYLLPLTCSLGERGEKARKDFPQAVIALLEGRAKGLHGVLYDALVERDFCRTLLDAIARRKRFKCVEGEVVGTHTAAFRHLVQNRGEALEPSILDVEQSNSSVAYGDRLFLKVIRRLEPGVNPELEIGRFLTERRFFHAAQVAGAIEYVPEGHEPLTLGILQGYVAKESDGWQFTLDALGRFFERAKVHAGETPRAGLGEPLLKLAGAPLPQVAYEMVGTYLESAPLLGKRTAELHLTLASATDDPQFVPEPFTAFHQRSSYQSRRNLASNVLQLLKGRLAGLPAEVAAKAQRVLDLKADIIQRFRSVMDHPISALRIRCHGDYHLGQVLYTGKDFVVIDFEGEPSRSLGERRLKRSALRDVAGMIRSFHYASRSALRAPGIRQDDRPRLVPWAQFWDQWVSVAFLRSYLEVAGHAAFLPAHPEETEILLEAHLLEKAIYELGYELNHRPDWLDIPLEGVLRMLERS